MSAGKSVLIVEDEAMISMMLEDFLDELGYACHGVAEDLPRASDLIAAGGFDAAILDCNLGGQKVWPVAHALAADGVPFIFATGGAGDDIPADLANRPTLTKPYTLGAVETTLASLLAFG